MLEAVDKLDVFDQLNGLNPFLLLDGHGSRFELEFLEYIHNEKTKWNCCIGLPYGTSYWQVGDSSEQNGCFKMALTKAKQELVMKKNEAGLEFAINRNDIVGLVRKAWNASFAREETNRKAVVHRGWGPRPLNYNALTHPEILATKPGYSNGSVLNSLNTDVKPEELNFGSGLAATLIEKIVLHKNKEGACSGENALENLRKRKATAEENLKAQDKRITAGLLAAAGKFHLSEDVRDYVKQKTANAQQKEYTKKMKLKDEYDELHAKVEEVKTLNLPPKNGMQFSFEQW